MTLSRGRPKADNPRSVVRSVHLTGDEDQLLVDAAVKAGQPVTAYIREAAVTKAKRAK